jgi:HEAT repeat protein
MGTLLALLLLTLTAQGAQPAPAGPAAPPVEPAADLARLRELLHGRQPQDQSQAALLLLQSPSPEAAELVREGLRRWDRADIFQALAAAVRLRRDARFVPQLVKALGSEQPAIRSRAVDALAGLDSPLTGRQLLAVAESPAATLTARQAATAALGRSVQKSAVEALLHLLSCDAPAVRQQAALSLEELTGQAYGADTTQWQAWWNQRKGMSDEEWLAGRTAYFADRARRLQDELQRAEAHILQLHQMMYSRIPPADRVSHFRTLAQSDYPAVRMQAVAWMLEALPQAAPAEQKQLTAWLLVLCDDGVEAVQREAVLALKKADDPQAFEKLVTLLQSGSVAVRAAAARSLGRPRNVKAEGAADLNVRAVAALEKALGDSSLAVVAEAAESLGSLNVPEAAPVLASLLKHPSDPVRQAASQGLKEVANVRVLSELFGDLDDPVALVRLNLVVALGRVGGLPALAEGLRAEIVKRLELVLVRDGDPAVRSQAAAVIGELGSATELNVLWGRVLATEDNRVQTKAWTAMLDILARSLNWQLVSQWEQTLERQKETTRRIELLSEVRNRWLKVEAAKPYLDPLGAALVRAQLAARKWQPALPLAVELAKKSPTEADLKERLRWLLVAGSQAVEDKKPQEAAQMLKDITDLLPRAPELAADFELLQRRATPR